MNVIPLQQSLGRIGSWRKLPFFSSSGQFGAICASLATMSRPVLPEAGKILRPFELTQMETVRVVIVGQDPYPNWNPRLGIGRATGLAFAVPDYTVTLPPSLRNIFAEIPNYRTGQNLEYWAGQGVLLVNTISAVPENFLQMSKKERKEYRESIGWHFLIRDVLNALVRRNNVFFMFFGVLARDMGIVPPTLRPQQNSLPNRVIGTSHPSRPNRKPKEPAWIAFKKSNPFLKANAFFQGRSRRQPPISW